MTDDADAGLDGGRAVATGADDTASAGKGAAVVTGASRGIGAELARLFAGTGHDVVLVARTESDLEERAERFRERFGVRAAPVAVDLTAPDAPEAVMAAVREADLVPTALVNNAGFGAAGRFDESNLERELGIVDVKVRAVTELTKLFLRAAPEDRERRVLNVASASAFVPGPKTAVYYAANAYGLSFSESLAAEFAGEDVTVTCLCPGPVDTGFHERAGTDERTVGLIPTPTMDARSVARAGFRGLTRGRTVVVPGLTMRLLVTLATLAPRPLVRRAMRYYNRHL